MNTISRLAVARLDDLFDRLNVDLTISGSKYIGNCPIHGNSDSGSFNLYYDGYSVPGYWKCRSKFCDKVFQPTIIGFTRGCLSHNELGYHWADRPKAIYSFPKTIDYLCKFLDVDYRSIKVDPKEQERLRFIAECSASLKEDGVSHLGIHRKKVRKSLIFPAKYFVTRGYSEEVLQQFDVGMAKVSKRETQDRVIVPIYNSEDYLIGYTCRSVFDKCELCGLFHQPKTDCPRDDLERNLACKWRHMNFNSEKVLYNFHQAKPEITKTNTAILVEGPGDVWKLVEGGSKNVVGLFGTNLSDAQERLLASAGCMTIICLLDNDPAGIAGMKRIKEKFGRLFRLYFINLEDVKDIGELNTDDITSRIKPMIDKILRIYNK